MKKITYILLSILFTLTACNKQEEEKKDCKNGGHQILDLCVCADGYTGNLCENGLNTIFIGKYSGSAIYSGIGQQPAIMLIEPHPNNDPRSIQIFRMENGNKVYLTDSRVVDKVSFYSLQDIGGGDDKLLVTGSKQTISNSTISFSIQIQKKSGSTQTLVNFNGSKVD